MEFLLPPSITVLPSIFALLLFLYYFHRKHSNATNKRSPPEAGGAWPLIGHLHLLSGTKPTHKVLGALADKHGPIFTIRFGVNRALVLSDSEIAKVFFTGSNDKVFSNRSKSKAMQHFSYNYACFLFSPYGAYWREMRKITVLELLSNHRLSMLRHVRESVVKNSVKEAYEIWVRQGICLVDMKRWFDEITMELIVRIIAGSGKKEVDNGVREAFSEFFKLMGVYTVADAIPFLRWLDIGGYDIKMKKTAQKMDDLIQRWLDEHKRRRSSSEAAETEAEKDFMDVMLEILDGGTNKALNFDADIINKSTCLGLTLAGRDSTSTTLTWAIALLLNNPHVLEKAQAELDMHVGRERQVEELDIKNLMYIQAITKETLRLYPPAQLLSSRESAEDCIVGGYHVSAGTRLSVNLWKIQRDPRVWPEPEEFRPERFLTTHKDVDLRGNHFELMPFGSGRRGCPGISFALQVVELNLASLVHAFEITTQTNEHVDMTESFGLTNVKLMPVEVCLTPRLHSELYG